MLVRRQSIVLIVLIAVSELLAAAGLVGGWADLARALSLLCVVLLLIVLITHAMRQSSV